MANSQLKGPHFLEGKVASPLELQQPQEEQLIIKRSPNPIAIIYVFILLISTVVKL